MKRVADAGHGFGLHGYSHANPILMTPDRKEAILIKCIDVANSFVDRQSHSV
jgi:peptidoglycan/xylan/chitin deacetylase (PgdA/CDA1 family)